MGAKRNSKETKDKAIAHWKSGRSQRWIADTLDVSPASINSWVKGIAQDNADIVNTQVSVKERLSALSEQELNAVTEHVDERTKHLQFFTNASLKNVSVMMKKIGAESSISEHRQAQIALKDAKEVVLGKTPDTAIQINNSPAGSYVVSPGKAASMEAWTQETAKSKMEDDE